MSFLMSTAFLAGVCTVGAVVGATDSPIQDSVASLVGGGVIAGGMFLMGTSHVSVRGGQLEFVNTLTRTTVKPNEIKEILTENGLQVRLTSGRAFGSLAYGPSLLALITGNRRAKRLGNRIVAVVGEPTPANTWTQDSARTFARWSGILSAMYVASLPMVVTIGVRVL